MADGKKEAAKIVHGVGIIFIALLFFTVVSKWINKESEKQTAENQRKANEQAAEIQYKKDALAAQAASEKRAAAQAILDTADKQAQAAEDLRNAAGIADSKRREGDAFKELHKSYPENVPLLFHINYPAENEAGIIMRTKHDDSLLLIRNSEDTYGKSDYELKWSSASTKLEEVVRRADNGLPQLSLAENLAKRQLRQMGWSDIKIDYGASTISGQYRYEYGANGLSFYGNNYLKYKVVVTKVQEGYPGAIAGLVSGDAIVAIDGFTAADDNSEQVKLKLVKPPGSRVLLRVFRSRADLITITLVKGKGGFGTSCITVSKTDIGSGEAVVTFVEAGSNAARAGIHIGDIITEIDKAPLQGLSDKEVQDRLYGKIDDIKMMHVSHFLDFNLLYDKEHKGEATISLVVPLPQPIGAPNNFSWPTIVVTERPQREPDIIPEPNQPSGALPVLLGSYQQTSDGKTQVWNNNPRPGDSALWDGQTDATGFATGKGILRWFKNGKFVTSYRGEMQHGRLNGLSIASDAAGREVDVWWSNGVKTAAPAVSHDPPILARPGGPAGYMKTRDGHAWVWNNAPRPDDQAEWSGAVDGNGYASGPGVLRWFKGDNFFTQYDGQVIAGRLEGRSVSTDASGTITIRLWKNGVKQ